MARRRAATASPSSAKAAHQESPRLEGSWDAASTESEGFGGGWRVARTPNNLVSIPCHDSTTPGHAQFALLEHIHKPPTGLRERASRSFCAPTCPLTVPCPGIPPQATPTQSLRPAG